MNEEIFAKKTLIDKYLKKKKYLCLFDILTINVDNISLYIRLDFIEKTKTYRVTWFNITQMNTNKVEDWYNSSLIYPSSVEKFKNIIATNGISQDYKDEDDIDSKVIINSYLINYEYNKKVFEFKRYIPKCWQFLADAIYILFDAMPKYIYPIFQIMVEKLVNPNINSIFVYDEKKDDIKSLFESQIIERGQEYYKDGKVMFIETINNITYSVVKGTQEYLVTINHHKDTNEMQLSCNCAYPSFCKHMYATILALQNKEEKKFYKITPVDNNKSLLDSIKDFNYFLCLGIVDDYFLVVDNNELHIVPILENNMVSAKIVEDDENKSLEKELKEYLDNHLK